ncbi:amino acid permease [Paenibacillus mendelii]|uniref:Amino acid permease n=1 Tax=Paenibacillus mendelii TaxID=206163 RepID=A0ABV6J6R3_9BACL|nr:amino acid permease [Paenibacillus mendelii]MCQ6560123.1 amino acid permease [Paenibacillus mendelii]
MAVIIGFLLFIAICGLSVFIGFIAHKKQRLSLHQSLAAHTSYVRFMQDKQDLNRLGIAQQLTRSMNGFSAFGLSFTNMSVIGGAAFLMAPAVAAGGPSVVGFGWPLIALCSLLVACSLASLASAVPTAGGCYHWSSAYGSRRMSLISGWLHAAGSILLLAATNLIVGAWLNDILAAIFGYEPRLWMLWAIVILMYITQAAVNLYGTSSLGRIFSGSSWLQAAVVIGTIVVLAVSQWPGLYPLEILFQANHPLESTAGSQSTSSFMVGLLLLARMFLGVGCAGHAAEETVDPRINTPWAIYLSVVYTFIFGFVLFAFLLMHYPSAAGSHTSWFVLTEWLLTSWKNWEWIVKPVAAALIAWVGWSSGLSSMTTGSRMWFTMARDESVPLSLWFAKVSERFRTPAYAVLLITGLACLVSAPALISMAWGHEASPAFIQLLALSLSALHLAYAVPIALKCYAKWKGGAPLPAGPWQLGRWGLPLDVAALLWLITSGICALVLVDKLILLYASTVLVLILIAVEIKGREWSKKGPLRAVGTVKFSKRTVDEMIRIERKFPQY